MERKDERAMSLKPVVIIAAVTGGAQRSRDGAFVPITPEEIAEEAVLCRKAGASVLHIHGRDKDGNS
jgi:3-keto-5-aminohexanoate cleavage enzyme